MALPSAAVAEIRPSTGSDNNGGMFCLTGNTYAVTDLACAAGTSANPSVTSATYTFVAGDVGDWVYVASGSNWTPGLYQIASVLTGAATLTAPAGVGTAVSLSAGSATIDRSQRTTPYVAIDNSAITTSINAAVVTFTGSTYTPNPMDVGNVVKVLTGTATLVSRYQIIALSVGSKTWTLDRTPLSSGTTTNATAKMGGAAATITSINTDVAANGAGGNKWFTKGEATISSTATIPLSAPGVTPSNAVMPSRIIGYATTRGDGGKATIQLSTNTGLTCLSATTTGWIVENFVLDANTLGTSTCFSGGANDVTIKNCLAKNFTTRGITYSGSLGLVRGCEVTGGTSAAAQAINTAGQGAVLHCNVHDNACPGIRVGFASAVLFNLVTNNSGSSSDGVIPNGTNVVIQNNTIYNSGRHGVAGSNSSDNVGVFIRNNILHSNGQSSGTGYGIQLYSSAGNPADPAYDGNAYYNNKTGARSNMDDTGAVNPINAISPYVNTLDVLLGADPLVNAGGGDFRLNSTPGAGLLLRGTATPGVLPGLSQSGSLDFGALQHLDFGPAHQIIGG